MPTCVRASAEMMPCVTVCPTANGLPIASTRSPTCSASESANSSAGKPLAIALEPQHREVGARVLEHDLGLELAPVGKRDLHLVGAVDDVVVGDYQPGRVDQHAGTERALLLLARPGHPRGPEEAAEERVLEQRIAGRDGARRIDVDHRRGRLLDHRRVGQPDLGRGRRNPAFLGRRARQGDAATRAMAAKAEDNGRRNIGRDIMGRIRGLGRPRYRAVGVAIEGHKTPSPLGGQMSFRPGSRRQGRRCRIDCPPFLCSPKRPS